jgi:ribosome-associated translation inhibitor RaiA
MTVNFQYVNVDVSETLSAFSEEKLEKLVTKFEFVISAQVYRIKLARSTHFCNIK